MTLRVRLTLGFTLLLLAPLILAASLLVAALRAGPSPDTATNAIRDVVAADCRHLQATADGLALTAAARGESLVIQPAGAEGPWAICGVAPASAGAAAATAGPPHGLAARAEVHGRTGELTGYAYAVRPLGDAYLARLSAAAGGPVRLADGPASGPNAREIATAPDQPLPLLVELPTSEPGGAWLSGAIAAVVAILAAAALAWWLAGLVTRPLSVLVGAVERATAGHPEIRFRLRGRDETGRLATAVNRLIGALEEAQRLSVTDPLTGLGNLRSLRESLRREVERANRFGHALGVLVLDLDHFKAVNDVYGHRAGDEVLTELAARIRGVIREVDLAFRQGGEEFVLLLPETDVQGCMTVARRLTQAVRKQPFGLARGEQPVPVTVSIGVAVYPRHGRTGGEVLDAADMALYRAKAAGRNTYRLAARLPEQRPPDDVAGYSASDGTPLADGTPAAWGRSGG